MGDTEKVSVFVYSDCQSNQGYSLRTHHNIQIALYKYIRGNIALTKLVIAIYLLSLVVIFDFLYALTKILP